MRTLNLYGGNQEGFGDDDGTKYKSIPKTYNSIITGLLKNFSDILFDF